MKISPTLNEKLATVQRVCILTGAGVSAESGVPTFRGEDGLWSKLKPEELASFEGFMKNPRNVWAWYNHRKEIMHSVEPNAAHYALATMESFYSEFTLVTQNIDNLHQRAGSKHVLELHGNIERSYCMECGKYFTDITVTEEASVPRCSCGGLVRPDVVWFGENLPEYEYKEAIRAASNCELFFSVGTSAVVYPAAWLPHVAKQHGAYLVEINMERTELSQYVDELLLGKAGEILPYVVECIKKVRS
ncbi:MAG: NAD-dependent deacylase [Bacteroidetes bacterium]|nr:NAD-dependent deacylase [Bacteroidota bacterium]